LHNVMRDQMMPAMPCLQESVHEVTYTCPADGTAQPMFFCSPVGQKRVPLLVGLHTWSMSYQARDAAYETWCVAKGWAFVYPNFRGPNDRPEAMGSDLVVQDILAAVEYAKQHAPVDPDRVYLIGGSGGGHAALLMAGRAPSVWAGVSAWVPIFDLRDWYREREGGQYAAMIAAGCGGAPDSGPEADRQYALRSPSTCLANAATVAVDINTGIRDGHTGSVPISHALNAYNALAAPADRLPPNEIARMTAGPEMPADLQRVVDDRLYAGNPVLFRRESNNVRITVFDGGHDMVPEAGLRWLEEQRRGRPSVWAFDPGVKRVLSRAEIKVHH
jgi:dienelactone hydrolase